MGWQVLPPATAGLGPHAAAWDELNQRLWGGHPLLCGAFVSGLLRHFGSGRERLCIETAPDGSTLAMCVVHPLTARAWATFMPPAARLSPMLMAGPESAQALLQALPGAVRQLTVQAADQRFGDLAWHNHRRPNGRWQRLAHHAAHHASDDGGFDAYWGARPLALRHALERGEQTLQGPDALQALTLTTPDDVVAACARLARLGTAADALDSRDATGPGAASPAQPAFLADTALALAGGGGAEVHELWAGPQLVASLLALVQGRVVVFLASAIDARFAAARPDLGLLKHAIREVFARHPGAAIELDASAVRDPAAWATGAQPIREHVFFRPGWRAELAPLQRTLHARRWPQRLDSARYSTESHADPDQLPPDVLALLAQAERASIQYGADWARNFCRHVALPDSCARFHVLRRDHAAIAVLPVLVRRGSLPGTRRVEALANYYSAVYAPALEAGVTAAELVPLVRSVLASARGVGELRFAPMDPACREHNLLHDALAAAGLVVFEFFSSGNWYLRCAATSWPAYLASRSAGLRSTLKRLGKKFAADGGTLEIISGGDRLASGIAAYEQVYAVSWKQPEPHPGFIPGLIETCAARGWLRLGVAWLDGQPVAAQLWIVAHGRADIYKVAYDDVAKQYSPGTLLTGCLVQHVLEQDHVHEVDYLIGDDRYKEIWMSDRRERWGLIACDPRTLTGLSGLVRETAGRLWKSLRRRVEPAAPAAPSP